MGLSHAAITEISSGITILLTALTIYWFKKSAQKAPKHNADRFVLSYGLPMKIGSVFSCILFLVVLILAIGAPPKEQLTAGFVVAMIAGCAGYLSAEFFGVRIEFDDRFIYCKSPWRSNRQIPWSSVVGREFSEAAQWHVIKTSGYGNVRLHVFLSGISSLLERVDKELESRTA